jgi:hypothetical protein
MQKKLSGYCNDPFFQPSRILDGRQPAQDSFGALFVVLAASPKPWSREPEAVRVVRLSAGQLDPLDDTGDAFLTHRRV